MNSLKYKFTISSSKDNLSPVIDLRSSSVKVISNIVEKGYGNETRYGRRYKVLSFYPIYKFNVTNLPVNSDGSPILPTVGQSVVGNTTKSRGEIIKVVGSLIYAKMKNSSLFAAGETLTFGIQSFNGVAVSPSGITEVGFKFTPDTNVEVYQENLSDTFANQIYAKIIRWDDKNKKLYVLEEKAPQNGNYFSAATGPYARNSSDEGANQLPDIIRVGDNLWHQQIKPVDLADTNESVPGFVEVSSIDYSNGVLYTSDINSKNSSSVSKICDKRNYSRKSSNYY